MNIALLLERAATASPERVAIYIGTQPLRSYRELGSASPPLPGR